MYTSSKTKIIQKYMQDLQLFHQIVSHTKKMKPNVSYETTSQFLTSSEKAIGLFDFTKETSKIIHSSRFS